MEYKNLDEIRGLAEVHGDLAPIRTLTQRERLKRWAEVLQRQEGRQLRSLMGTEFVSREERARMRIDNSPLTVAYEDPILRTAGLPGDKFGDAVTFFGLGENDVHNLVCYCRHGRTMMAEAVARDVRTLATYRAVADFVTARTVVAGASALAAVAVAMVMV